MTDNVKENHDSLNQLVKECQIDTISHDEMNRTGDQKVQNDCAGGWNHKSTHPCGLCIAKGSFDGKDKA